MQYRTLLVNLNDEHRVPELLAAAAYLARQADAHLIGLYVMPSVLPTVEMIGPIDNTWLETQMRYFDEQAKRIKEVFETELKISPFTHEWRLDNSRYDKTVADSVIDHAHAADLVIVSQGSQNYWIDEVPERTAIESGRPVLVIPRAGKFEQFGAEVTIAWTGTKEATRAVYDALPLLKKARHVRLLSMVEDAKYSDESSVASSADIAAVLSRHGVHVDADVRPKGDQPVRESLLEIVNSANQDLLVMGVYGHSRFREFLLGGTSRHILRGALIPVFISH